MFKYKNQEITIRIDRFDISHKPPRIYGADIKTYKEDYISISKTIWIGIVTECIKHNIVLDTELESIIGKIFTIQPSSDRIKVTLREDLGNNYKRSGDINVI